MRTLYIFHVLCQVYYCPKKPKSRSPDYILKAKRKSSEGQNKIGAAWINSDGSLTIKLDVGTSLHEDPDILTTLFPNDSPRV